MVKEKIKSLRSEIKSEIQYYTCCEICDFISVSENDMKRHIEFSHKSDKESSFPQKDHCSDSDDTGKYSDGDDLGKMTYGQAILLDTGVNK